MGDWGVVKHFFIKMKRTFREKKPPRQKDKKGGTLCFIFFFCFNVYLGGSRDGGGIKSLWFGGG